MQIIIDFDGTLTAEETQAEALRVKSLSTLADKIIGVSYEQLLSDYLATRSAILATPHRYWWQVNGLVASYCDEGAFILNTTTLQTMLNQNPIYAQAVSRAFPNPEYDPVMDCVNHLFHRHTAEIEPSFRPAARQVLNRILAHPTWTPVILTNSMGTKVREQLDTLSLDDTIRILGDTRQYEMAPDWEHRFNHPELGRIQVWPISRSRQIDLRRPIYYAALCQAQAQDPLVVVVADSLSLPGALPLMMGLPFFLIRTPYTPNWCSDLVRAHPFGHVLDDLALLPNALEAVT